MDRSREQYQREKERFEREKEQSNTAMRNLKASREEAARAQQMQRATAQRVQRGGESQAKDDPRNPRETQVGPSVPYQQLQTQALPSVV